ncbi:prepilin-type N-terminal cleavage/methylation domain-containing protein [Pseudomonas stutzeri]|uniref:type IV pilin protein n=1 Tax=Stutzerimonas stutzeri TaxID=316 RepID=UPI0009B6642D|nr:prepilin-type N-terminal cleavage/methylation domain-containing protein [Stutzerimonas stutzeri]MBO0643136.1 prepilin-type N-terminal cleavage/methylation domain-containing protein [Stutzerimonas stutzeri]HAB85315.1 prepilin-type N-terminal cleavage/methylation domain-containing protein [Pseudomonas sp.]
MPQIRHGFTLIELIIVIAILSIVTAIAIPIFYEQKRNVSDSTAHADVANATRIIQAAVAR